MIPLPRRLLIVIAIVVALYGLAGFLIAPPLLRSALLDSLGRTLVTRPSLGRVRIDPFALSITLEKLELSGSRGRPVAGFDRLYLRFDPARSLWLRAWTLAELRLDRPSVALEILPDRTLNLARLLRPGPAGPDSGGRPPSFRVHRLRILDGSLGYSDLSRQPALSRSLSPIRIELTDFGSRRDSRNEYSFEARTDAGEGLFWHGRFDLQPFRSEGELRVSDLRARTLSDFLGDLAPFVVSRGVFAFGARYRVDASKTPAEVGLSGIALDARAVALQDRASGEEVISAGEVTSRGGTFDLARAALDLGEVRGRLAHVLLWMTPDGHINFEHWAQPAAADTSKPMLATLPSVHVDGLSLDFQDRRLQPAALLGVRSGTVDVKGFSTAPGSSFNLAAACSLGAGGVASASGTVVPAVPSADLAVDVRGFDLRGIEDYVHAFARLRITRGSADAKGRLAFNVAGARGPLLRFVGDASSRDFLAVDEKVGKDFLAWKQLELKGLRYDALPGRMALREIDATRPYLRAIVAPDRTTNIQALQVPPDSVPAAFRPAPGVVDTMPVSIDLVKVSDGSMYFADLSLTPNFATGIRSLDGTIRELSSAEAAHAAVQLDGKVDAYAPAKISGTLNPLNGHGRTDLDVSFKNIELTTFSPYSGKFMGYRIEKGKLDLDLNYKIENRQLDATNKVFMRQLTLGDKVPSPDATKLPVRFAIALLKDREGNIDLNLPVKGNLDDPKFSVFPIIMKVFIGLITKAVASPFALLGAAFGGGEHENPAVTFAYGSAEIDSTDMRLLQTVRKGLTDRPALKLEIEQPDATEGDSLALLARRYGAELRGAPAGREVAANPAQLAAARALAPSGFTPGEWVGLLTRDYAARIGKPPALQGRATRARAGVAPDSSEVAAESGRLRDMDARVRARIALDPLELDALGRRRVRRVRDIMLADSTIAPERVYITNRGGAARADSTGVHVSLTLTD